MCIRIDERQWRRTLGFLIAALGPLLAAGGPAGPAPAPPAKVAGDPWIPEHLEALVGLYQHLHIHPELSYQEHETARRIAEELRKTGAQVTPGVGKLGVVGVLENGPGPVVLVRTDMDALPVVEATGV